MDLVILAAGMGSRFGGNKQTEPVDKDGNFILDYSVFDAIRAGFDRVVLIIRKENQQLFEDTVVKRLRKFAPVVYAFQNVEDVPKGTIIPPERKKPWGTAHALYECKNVVSDKFAVINADDFYGFNSFKIIADFLKQSKENEFVSAGYEAQNTLSDTGAVKRGIFSLQNGKATNIVESKIEKRGGRIFATPLNEENWKEIRPQTMVSMTMFGFSKNILKEIREMAQSFFRQGQEKLATAEFLLPDVVGHMLKEGKATMHVLPTSSKWYGMTYREELVPLKNAIQSMKDNGQYPQNLYGTQQGLTKI